MAILQWSSQVELTNPAGVPSGIELEHVLALYTESESVERASTVTTRAVEGTDTFADHKRREPVLINLNAIITNTPLGRPLASGFGFQPVGVTERSDEEAGVTVAAWTDDFDTVADSLATLQRLADEPILVRVETEHGVIPQATVVSVSDPVTSGIGADSARVTIQLQEVRIATTSMVGVSPYERQTTGPRPAQTDEEATEGDEGRVNRSVLQTFRQEGLDGVARQFGFGGDS